MRFHAHFIYIILNDVNAVCLSRSEREQLNSERDMLMKKLVEVEMDGQAAAKQVAALRDSMHRLRQVRSALSAALIRHYFT